MGTLRKHCVFCGAPPADKTKEHVVPQWLIKLTGKPDRKAFFGYAKNLEEKAFKRREYAFDQLTFPACASCNKRYSALEDHSKDSLTAVIEGRKLSSESLSELLDWFDKVRVGLWLGMRMLDNNMAHVDPNFHIATRMGQFDRLLIVEKSDTSIQALNFGGTALLSFAITPSAFLLRVNNYYFTNVSSMYLCARRLGFPFPVRAALQPRSEHIKLSMSKGAERVRVPVLRKRFSEIGPRFFQPMYPSGGLAQGDRGHYESTYVKRHSLDFEAGVGNIFQEIDGRLVEHGAGAVVSLEPSSVQAESVLRISSEIHVLEWQNWLTDQLPSLEELSKEQRHRVRRRFNGAKRLNHIFMDHLCGLL